MFLSNPELGRKEAYVPGLTQEHVAKRYGIPIADVAKLGSAENPFGPSPKAAEAVKAALKHRQLSGLDRAGVAREESRRNTGIRPIR